MKNTRKVAVAQYLSTVEGKNWTVTNLVSETASDYYQLLALDLKSREVDALNQAVT